MNTRRVNKSVIACAAIHGNILADVDTVFVIVVVVIVVIVAVVSRNVSDYIIARTAVDCDFFAGIFDTIVAGQRVNNNIVFAVAVSVVTGRQADNFGETLNLKKTLHKKKLLPLKQKTLLQKTLNLIPPPRKIKSF